MSAVEQVASHLDITDVVGGPARRTVVLLLAGVLGLQAADIGSVGALAEPLEKAFHIGNTDLGLLVTVTTLVGVVATLPFGKLSDRHSRTLQLQAVVSTWAIATLLSALSTSFVMLLLSRLALGGVVAAAGPAIASLVGDLFPGDERARLYGYILTGELIGAGIGIMLAGALSDVLGWRAAIGFLAIPACVLAWALRRYLPEPARGGQAHLQVGDDHIVTEEDATDDSDLPMAPGTASRAHEAEPEVSLDEPSAVEKQAVDSGAEPHPDTVVDGDEDMNMWDAVRYVLRVRTNVALILASGLGYFFFAGLETFAELYFRARYGVSQSVAAVLFILVAAGALVGVVLSGRTADRLIRKGKTTGRLTVAAVAYVASTVLFIPGALLTSLALCIPIFLIAAVALGAVNAPTDAARLDVLPSHLWGRAEAVRTVFRQLLQGFAPVVFGAMSAVFGTAGAGFGAGIDTGSSHGSPGTAHGLEIAFILLSLPLAVSGVILWFSRRRYLDDVVAARRSDENRARFSEHAA